ncbi:MAG: YggS family pyridoxal phosphate-dependent enzyme [Thiobacillus sp.]
MDCPIVGLVHNLAQVKARVHEAAQRAGRDPAAITLLAVSKMQSPQTVCEAAQAGQQDFGENYLQEALDKQIAVANPALIWHFIGPIQSNKTRAIAENFAWVHSIDRLRIAQRLSAQRPAHAPPLNVCIEVNVSGEASKSGVAPEAVVALAEQVTALPQLKLRGLMAIPAPSSDVQRQRQAFAQVRALFDALKQGGLNLDTLSMGMSDDMEAAIAEDATIVRIGTAIFGARPALR